MTIVAAFLSHGHPLPYLQPDNPAYRPLAEGYRAAAERLAAARPDVILAYSTQWFAVLDELWQTRARLTGLHVDENWYAYGDLKYEVSIDQALAQACVAGSRKIGVSAKGVDHDGFPIDSGTIVMANSLDPTRRYRFVLASNNLYHDAETTGKLAAMAVAEASAMGKRVAVVGVGGLSGSIFRERIDLARDRILSDEDDRMNRELLARLESGDRESLDPFVPKFAQAVKADMGMKHLSWLIGAVADRYAGANVLGYGPAYGAGQAIVELRLK
jgi:2-aminophenol/2-amino-5-chlorophenol 1,6-dioxygenase alpha subunit